ncbi:MAG: hypothetical protein Q8891_02165 [Bacteroidota bacterium]|nr:hypothetical protein [Bacteroidota bacterium]
MKKITLCLMAACLSLSFIPVQSFASIAAPINLGDKNTPAAVKANAILLRINEIKNMDKSNLTSSDKKALRKELHSMKHELRSNGGVYLSVGAIIIIILLLILLL